MDPVRVPRIENRAPRIRKNHHRVPRIKENRVPRIREIGSIHVHIGYLTFSLKKKLLVITSLLASIDLQSASDEQSRWFTC